MVVAVAVLVLAVFGGWSTVADNARNRHLIDCVARYGDGVAAAISERSAASEDDRQALINLLTAVSHSDSTPTGQALAVDALNTYLSDAQKADDKRKASPYPAPPRLACGS